MSITVPNSVPTRTVFGYIFEADGVTGVEGAVVKFTSKSFSINENLLAVNEEVITDSAGRYQAVLVDTVDTDNNALAVIQVDSSWIDVNGETQQKNETIVTGATGQTDPISVEAARAEAFSGSIITGGPAGPAGAAGATGAPGTVVTIPVVNVDDPSTEFNLLNISSGTPILACEVNGGGIADEKTEYIFDSNGPAVNIPYSLDTLDGGTTRWVAVGGKYNNNELHVNANITTETGVTVDGRDLSADGTKLDGIETGATADQTGAEIKLAYEAELNTNAFTDAEQTKLTGIEAGATADQTGAEIKLAYEAELDTNAFTDAEQTKLTGIEAGATADQTGAEIKLAYEAELDTNAFTDAEQTKLTGIEAGATADQTGAEIKLAYEAELDTNAFTDAEQTKLTGIETSADVTDEANVTSSLSGATLTAVTVAATDKVLIQDVDDADNLKTVTASQLTGGGGVTDHGALTGLGDDDHTQYLNETRHDSLPADNPHSVTKSQVGLGNVDNTSDADKPVSTAQQTALDLKYDDSNPDNFLNETTHDALAADNPHSVTFTQAVTADGTTDITGAECETLTDGSNADALHVHATDFSEFSGVTVSEPTTNGADFLVDIDTTNHSSTSISLASNLLTLAAGTYLIAYGGNFIAQSQNNHRICLLDPETAASVGAFSKVARGRCEEVCRSDRNGNVSKSFIYTAAAGDRLRFVINIDSQASNTEFSEFSVNLIKVA